MQRKIHKRVEIHTSLQKKWRGSFKTHNKEVFEQKWAVQFAVTMLVMRPKLNFIVTTVHTVRRGVNIDYDEKYTTLTLKHGDGSPMFWVCVSYCGTENLSKLMAR